MKHDPATMFLTVLAAVAIGGIVLALITPRRYPVPPPDRQPPPTGSGQWARRGDGWVCTHCGGRGSGWNPQFGNFVRVCANCDGRPHR